QATHGVVTGQPKFFKRAFGGSISDFEALLLRPHHFIFNREWYESLDGRSEYEEYQSRFARLTSSQKAELLNLLSSRDPRKFIDLPSLTRDPQLRNTLKFYVPISKEEEATIWAKQKARVAESEVPEDERVE